MGCGSNSKPVTASTSEIKADPVYATLSASVDNYSIRPNGTAQVYAYSGVPPYLFSIYSGGGSVDSSTGVFRADSVAGTTTLQVTDAGGATSYVDITITSSATTTTTTTTSSGPRTHRVGCAAAKGKRVACYVGLNLLSVTLETEYSSGICVEGRTWATDFTSHTVVVANGCQANFLVTTSR